jgi:hypothetical protein
MRQLLSFTRAHRHGGGPNSVPRAALCLALSLLTVCQFTTLGRASAATGTTAAAAAAPPVAAARQQGIEGTRRPVTVLGQVNVKQIEKQEALNPSKLAAPKLRAIHPPKGMPVEEEPVPFSADMTEKIAKVMQGEASDAPTVAGTPSPYASLSFKSTPLLGGSIPPDTMGALSGTHVVTTTNDRMTIHSRSGLQLSQVTTDSFWSTLLVGGAPPDTFDPRIYFDRFNGRFIYVITANAGLATSATLLAVSQTSDPTGTWDRYAIDAEAANTNWADFPSVGFNKNWIVISVNIFTNAANAFVRPDIYVIDKPAIYAASPVANVTVLTGAGGACPPTGHCSGTYSPSVVEDNTTENIYLAQNWNSTSGLIRISKIAPVGGVPVLSPGTQFPASPNSWDTVANIVAGSGGFVPQRQQNAFLPSNTRTEGNDARIQNVVLRNGSLWAVHHVMLSTVPLPAGTNVSTTNPDNHTAVQWWEVNPAIENSVTTTAPVQRGRIEDPLADNCHNGASGLRTTDPTCDTNTEQRGTFYTFPSISVNANNDVLIGYSRHSADTYPNAAYSFRAAGDPPNTMRDSAIIRAGMGAYALNGGTVRWGDYSYTTVDPLNDTDFWTVQEYAERASTTVVGITPPWSTYWAQVKPSNTSSTTGGLRISEFRLRGPVGTRDEFVELFNPSNSPLTITTADGSSGWLFASSTDGTTVNPVTVIPNGTTIPARGYYLISNNTTGTGVNGPYGLNNYPNIAVRGTDGDASYSVDIADNSGLAIFRTANLANVNAATRVDSVGFTTQAVGLFKEGAGLPPLSTTAADYADQLTIFRSLASTGEPRDTEANENDFLFANTSGTNLGMGQRVGSPGPQNVDSPLQRNATIKASLVDPAAASTAAPNRVRDLNPFAYTDPTTGHTRNFTNGTLAIRRKFTNNTGETVTRLRFRAVDITSGPAPAGTADVRALSNAPFQITVSGSPVTVQGVLLEEPPNASTGTTATGGGYLSSVSCCRTGFSVTGERTVDLATPLAPGGSVNVEFLLGVEQPGNFRFLLNIEAQSFPVGTPLRSEKITGKGVPASSGKPRANR